MPAAEPAHAEARTNLAVRLLEDRRIEDAANEFRRILETHPREVVTRSNLGVALMKLGRLAEAEPELQRVVAERPGFAKGVGVLGDVLLNSGRYREAAGHLDSAVRLDPALFRAWLNLGAARAGMGGHVEALAAFRSGMDFATTDARWHQLLEEAALEAERDIGRAAKIDACWTNGTLPEPVAELLACARVALSGSRPLIAGTWFQSVLDREQSLFADARVGNGITAARAFVLASRVPDLTGEEAERWRGRGRSLLEHDLRNWERLIGNSRVRREMAREALETWRCHPDFATVREDAHLETLPEAEPAAWRSIWKRVDSLIQDLE